MLHIDDFERNESIKLSKEQDTYPAVKESPEPIAAAVKGVRYGWTHHVVQVHVRNLQKKRAKSTITTRIPIGWGLRTNGSDG